MLDIYIYIYIVCVYVYSECCIGCHIKYETLGVGEGKEHR